MENICDWKNCKKAGKHKAPVEKDNSKRFRWLCIDHIKEFNKNWDYFSGMNENEIMQFIKSDMTWHKPTQSFGSTDNFFKILWNNILRDKEGIFSEPNSYKNKLNSNNFSEKDIQAFKILKLNIGAKWPIIKSKFKSLVKKFHPDMNSGNKEFENELKKITLAYSLLKEKYKEKNIDT